MYLSEGDRQIILEQLRLGIERPIVKELFDKFVLAKTIHLRD
jgi:hypothetical protein